MYGLIVFRNAINIKFKYDNNNGYVIQVRINILVNYANRFDKENCKFFITDRIILMHIRLDC